MTLELTAEERAALSENSKILLAMWEAEDRGDQAEADRPYAHGDQELTGWRRPDPENEPEHPLGR